MPEISRANVETWKLRFRRKYPVAQVAALRTLADTIADEAGEVVTITSSNMEGGSASGQITGNKLEMLTAAEELLADPLYLAGITSKRPRVWAPDFSRSAPV